jgi:cell division septation protein DedD
MDEKSKTRLEIWSLRFDILLRLLLIAAVIAVVLVPGAIIERVNTSLARLGEAGVEEISLFGVKFKIPKDEAETVNAEVTRLADQLALLDGRRQSLEQLLQCQAAQDCTSEQQSELASIIETDPVARNNPTRDQALVEITRQVQTALSETNRVAAKGRPLPVPAETNPNGAVPDTWVVVFGADKTIESAQYELETLTRAGFQGYIVRRGSWFRTLATFPSQEAADSNAPAISRAVGRQVFVLNLEQWCPGIRDRADGIKSCS